MILTFNIDLNSHKHLNNKQNIFFAKEIEYLYESLKKTQGFLISIDETSNSNLNIKHNSNSSKTNIAFLNLNDLNIKINFLINSIIKVKVHYSKIINPFDSLYYHYNCNITNKRNDKNNKSDLNTIYDTSKQYLIILIKYKKFMQERNRLLKYKIMCLENKLSSDGR